jgi:DNA-binding NarL/FixJ family response regulator
MRVLLADHHETARWAIRTRLQEEPCFELVGETANAESTLHLAEYQVINVYAIRMAGVFMFSLGAIWLRTGLMHRG